MKANRVRITDRVFRWGTRTGIFWSPAVALCLLVLGGPAHAATMSASPTPPAVNGMDIANFGTVTGNEKWWAENTADGSAKGQTFTTGVTPLRLKAITYQVTASQKAEPTKTYVIRVGTVVGTVFTRMASETATQSFTWNGGEYMTWTFSTSVLLAANTTYGVDVGMTGSTSGWQTGIPYINFTANGYAGGVRYSSGTLGVGTSNLSLVAASDRIFHLDLEHPMRPSPEIGATVPAGDVVLSWSNLAPSVGSDVWVDVWFGTNAGALAQVVSVGQNVTTHTVFAPGGGTYYWRVDSYLDGTPTGPVVTGDLFHFVVTDSDGDGLPDAYELAHTTPPSATALNPGDDLEPDGLTNLQEYQTGTDPNDDDTDNDTLLDGPELGGVGSRPPTSPLRADTDGDGLNDGVESNTGNWAGGSDTGTDPTKADTDGDALKDGVENNTGTYGSPTNTGTNPLLQDSDGDGAGDWYEVAASYTDPNNPAEKPNVPYPLPKPDGSTGATNKRVKVFILSGQSNMVGMGDVDPMGTTGTLSTVVKRQGKFPNLVATNGAWSVHSNVWYRSVISEPDNAPLKVGQGAGTAIGPELGFGHVMGWYFDEPVLLLKTSIGNRSLLWDCLPPGSPRFNFNTNTYAGYGDYRSSWPIGGSPSPFVWYAGKQYDDYFLDEEDMGAPAWTDATYYYTNGIQVRHNGQMYISKGGHHTSSSSTEPGAGGSWTSYWNVYAVSNAVDVLDHWATDYPRWAAQGFEIAGFVWWQGNKDLGEPGASRYETNLVRFIKQVRAYYANRYPDKCSTNTPFAIATGCGDPGTSGYGLAVANAQLAVSGERGTYPEFTNNVKTMDTRGYWRSIAESPVNQGYHYNRNAETYVLTGDALGRGMIELLGAGTTNNDYAAWAAGFPGAVLGDPQADFDGDGAKNDEERIWGLNPTNPASRQVFSSTFPVTTGAFSYTRRVPALTGYGYTVWTSTNMETWVEDAGAIQTPGAPVADVETVAVSLSPALRAEWKLFVRLRAAPN